MDSCYGHLFVKCATESLQLLFSHIKITGGDYFVRNATKTEGN